MPHRGCQLDRRSQLQHELDWAGNTADGWPELRAKRGQLAGRLTRLRSLLSIELDEDGNPIPVRRHHPDDPKRIRGRRFAIDR